MDETVTTLIAVAFAFLILGVTLFVLNLAFGFNTPAPQQQVCAEGDLWCGFIQALGGVGTAISNVFGGIGRFFGLLPSHPSSLIEMLSLRYMICGQYTIWSMGCHSAMATVGGLIGAAFLVLLVFLLAGDYLMALADKQLMVYGIVGLIGYLITGFFVNIILDFWFLLLIPLALVFLIKMWITK